MKKHLSLIFNILIILAFFGLCAVVIAVAASTFTLVGKNNSAIFSVAGILIAVFTVPLVHELGHLVFGLFNKMALHSMRIGFLTFYRSGGKIRLRFTKIGEYAGACEMIPKTPHNLYRRFLLMAAGGNIFSLIYLALTVLFFSIRANFSPYLYFFFTAGLPVAFYLFIVNMIGGGRTDGRVILGLLRKEPQSMVTVNILSIQSKFFEGKLPSEIDKEFYFSIPQTDDVYLSAVILNLQYVYYRDSGDVENAYQTAIKLEDFAKELDERTAMNILCDSLYERIIRGEQQAAIELYKKTEKYLRSENSATNLRIRAAYALIIDKDLNGARRLLNLALDECKKTVIIGIARFEEKILNELKAQFDAAFKLHELEESAKIKNKTHIF